MKKVFLPVIIIILIGIIAAGLFFFRDTQVGEDNRTIGSFFPFGSSGDALEDTLFPPVGGVDEIDGISDSENVIVLLHQIHTNPVAGAVVFGGEEEQPRVRFMERSVGHIFESGMLGVDKKRISNETLPGIYNALWDGQGEDVAFTQLDNGVITTFTAELTLDDATSTPTLFDKGSYLPEQIVDATSFGDKLFYLYPVNEGIVGTITSFDGENKNRVFESPLTEWLVSWVNSDTILLTTKPSAEVPGYAYVLDIGSEQTAKVMGSIPGLTANMSPNEDIVLYTEGGSNGMSTFLYNTETETSALFPANTLPEKCIWSTEEPAIIYCAIPGSTPRASYPDDWYKGLISFSDSIWKIDTNTNLIEVLSTPQTEALEEIDIINPMLSPNEDFLIFTNKKDSTLWSLQLVVPTPPEEVDDAAPDDFDEVVEIES